MSHEGERHGGGVKTGGENVTTERVCGINETRCIIV